MYKIVEFLFSNIILVTIIAFFVYIYVNYKQLQEKKSKMNYKFERYLNKYIGDKINTANNLATKILNEYGREDAVRTEIIRLQMMIQKGVDGTIADKVNTCNILNKFKVNKELDVNKYTYFKELENIKPFYDIEDLNSIKDDIAIARREYNLLVLEYNEKASSVIMQYAAKVLNIETQFPLFDSIKEDTYDKDYEVFDENEHAIKSLSSLDRGTVLQKQVPVGTPNANPTPDIKIEHSKETFKPSININTDVK